MVTTVFLVDKKSPQQIADCLEQLMNISLWKTMAGNARKSFEEKFSYDCV
jgi:hypothetical protein